MKVENPKFDHNISGQTWCEDCPFEAVDAAWTKCGEWVSTHGKCPTAETYDEAVRLAEDPK